MASLGVRQPTALTARPAFQIRAARMLAGLTQVELARAAGCHPRSVRYWESKGTNPPTNVTSTLDSIEQALNRPGVIPFSTPTLGVRLL
ncbi:MAG: helix-turn-helix transcriptional regulator [Alphaproteobacteria bacterium]|nr:MAG: helix-turn-helix transcriptional regulator [Alphaproteobacteria bacterium]